MREYKFYILDREERIFLPPLFVNALDDETALKSASQLVLRRAVEVWQGDRFVACLKPIISLGRKPKASDQEHRTQPSPDQPTGLLSI